MSEVTTEQRDKREGIRCYDGNDTLPDHNDQNMHFPRPEGVPDQFAALRAVSTGRTAMLGVANQTLVEIE